MLEQYPTPEQKPQLPEEGVGLAHEEVLDNSAEVNRGFHMHEREVLEYAGSVLDEADAENLKKPSFKALAAALVFCAATSASVESSASTERGTLEPLQDEQQNVTQVVSNKNAQNFQGIQTPFDWSGLALKVEGGQQGVPKNGFEVMSILSLGVDGKTLVMDNYEPVQAAQFYEGVTKDAHRTALRTLWKGIHSAEDYSSFKTLLEGSPLSDQQKLLALQNLGGYLSATYNYDMLKNEEYVVVSDDKMFEGVKSFVEKTKDTEILRTGICGNIHTFLVKTATGLGFDAWLQSGSVRRSDDAVSGHVWAGLIAKDPSGKEQVVFLDYDKIIPTGTMNYQDALGVAERYAEQISLFSSYVGAPGGGRARVKSAAQKSIETASGFTGSERILEDHLQKEIITHPEGLGLSVSDATTEVVLSKDMLAFAFTHMNDSENNPYQSLSNMDALRASLNFGGKHIGIDAGATLLNLSIKDVGGGTIAQREIITHLGADFINSHNFTKGEYERFVVQYGASVEAGTRRILGEGSREVFGKLSGGMLEGTVGAKILYTDPANTGTVYLGVSDTSRVQLSGFEEQETILHEISQKLSVGASVNVHEATVIGFDASIADVEYGQKQNLKTTLTTSGLGVDIEGERVSSDMKMFIPSSEKVSVGVNYHPSGSPIAEIGVFGSVKRDHYKNTSDSDYTVGVKARILVW